MPRSDVRACRRVMCFVLAHNLYPGLPAASMDNISHMSLEPSDLRLKYTSNSKEQNDYQLFKL